MKFAERVAAERPALMRAAQHLLRNKAWAEDAVSETLLAALEKPSAFGGSSSLRTWLVAILKHKIVDQVRRHRRECVDEPSLAAPWSGEGAGLVLEEAQEAHVARGDPQEWVSRLQFMARLDQCLRRMPSRQARAFFLRNALEQETAEICDELGVTANTLYGLLHRANLQLREALRPSRVPAHGPGGLCASRA